MKISVDNTELYELSEHHKRVIQNDIQEEIFDADMKRRLHWVLMHKYERCFDRLEKEWRPKIEKRYESVPTSKEAFAALIFAQPDYQSRSAREKVV